jgi:hypothetical protein
MSRIAPRPKEQRERAKQLWQSGQNLEAVALAVNAPRETIKSWRHRGKWVRQPVEAAPIVPTEIVDVDVSDDLTEQQQEYEQNLRKAGVLFSRKIAAMEPEEVLQKADRVKQLDSTARKALRIESEKAASVIQLAVLCAPVRPAERNDGRLRSVHRSSKLIEAESEPVVTDSGE